MGMSKSNIGYVNERFGNEPGKVPIWNWNPGGCGCTGGCKCCWARPLGKRMKGKCEKCFNFKVHLHPERLPWPAKKKKPGLVLSGFTHDWMDKKRPDQDIEDIMAAMVAAPQHQFVTLTQQAEHLAKFYQGMFSGMGRISGDEGAAQRIKMLAMNMSQRICIKWPPPHIWNGCTIRTQAEATARLSAFLEIPGKKWISAEPLWRDAHLNLVQKTDAQMICRHCGLGTNHAYRHSPIVCWNCGAAMPWTKAVAGVIVGHDNRKGAPGTHRLSHIYSVVDQCKAAGVACYVKQIHHKGRFLRASHPDEFVLYPADLKLRDLPWSMP